MSYEVGFKPSALREVQKLDEVTRKAIISEVELLADNPRPDGCKKLKGESNLYRIRVLSNYRVVYYVTNIEGKTIDVIVPVELWQQIINSINIDSNLSQQEDNLESFALQNLAQCYGEDEPEYPLELIKEHNNNYARK